MPFEFTKNYKFTILNNENVWAKAMNRVVNETVAGREGGRRDDRAHQAGRGLIGSHCPLPACGERPRRRATESIGGSARVDDRTAERAAGRPPARPKKGMSPWQTWGLILLAPYVLVFLVFVLYPVGYGLWLARHPESYVQLFDDPIFLRSVVNTLVVPGRRASTSRW